MSASSPTWTRPELSWDAGTHAGEGADYQTCLDDWLCFGLEYVLSNTNSGTWLSQTSQMHDQAMQQQSSTPMSYFLFAHSTLCCRICGFNYLSI